jgi:hypothetical protein
VRRRTLVILSVAGLVCAITESVVFAVTYIGMIYSLEQLLGEASGGLAAGVLAGILVTSYGPTRARFATTVSVLSGLAGLGLMFAIDSPLDQAYGPHPDALVTNGPQFDWTTFIAVISATTLVLAATLSYRASNPARDSAVRTPFGFVLVLLCGIIPVLNVLGFAGLTIYALVRRPPTPTPARPAASA